MAELDDLYKKEKEVLDNMTKRDKRVDWDAKIRIDNEFTIDDWIRIERIVAEQEIQERGISGDEYHN